MMNWLGMLVVVEEVTIGVELLDAVESCASALPTADKAKRSAAIIFCTERMTSYLGQFSDVLNQIVDDIVNIARRLTRFYIHSYKGLAT